MQTSLNLSKSNDFMGNLLATLNVDSVSNKILSPASIYNILAPIYLGSGGKREEF